MFASIHLDGVEAGVAGLAGNGGAVGTVAGALGDETGSERVATELGQGGGVVAGVFSAAADGLVDCGPGQCGGTEVAVFCDSPE